MNQPNFFSQSLAPDVEQDWRESDKYLPYVRRVLEANAGYLLNIRMATDLEDTQYATDMVAEVHGGTICIRVRFPPCQYRDLTIRAFRTSGIKTEIDKIKDGFGNYYLYGWGDGISRLDGWILVDLDKVRTLSLLDNRRFISNPDGRTGFVAIPAKELYERGCILNSGGDWRD